MRRREFITLLGGSVVLSPMTARAQQAALPIVGFLSSLSAAALSGPIAAFRDGLGSVGYEEGKNVTIEFRWAEGHYDLLPALADELVKQRAAVIVAVGGDPPAFAAKAASTTIPLVFMVGQDPVKLGLVTSLNRPGGNATGINLLVTETESKRVEILKQLAPAASRFAALINPKNADADVQSSAVKAAAQAIGQQIEIINLAVAARHRLDAVHEMDRQIGIARERHHVVIEFGRASGSNCNLFRPRGSSGDQATRPSQCLDRLVLGGGAREELWLWNVAFSLADFDFRRFKPRRHITGTCNPNDWDDFSESF